MQPEDITTKVKAFNIVFSPDAAALPVHYANALNIVVGPGEFFMTIGTVTPPEIRSAEDVQALDTVESLTAQAFVRMALSPQAMEQFIALMSQQFRQFVLMQQQLGQSAGPTAAQDTLTSEDGVGDKEGKERE